MSQHASQRNGDQRRKINAMKYGCYTGVLHPSPEEINHLHNTDLTQDICIWLDALRIMAERGREYTSPGDRLALARATRQALAALTMLVRTIPPLPPRIRKQYDELYQRIRLTLDELDSSRSSPDPRPG